MKLSKPLEHSDFDLLNILYLYGRMPGERLVDYVCGLNSSPSEANWHLRLLTTSASQALKEKTVIRKCGKDGAVTWMLAPGVAEEIAEGLTGAGEGK